MAEPPVVNASPLIFLANAGLLEMLKGAGSELVVTQTVVAEITRRGASDPTVQALERSPWLKVIEPPPIPSVIQAWDLGEGESSTLAWAYRHPGTEAILDDLAARRCAAALGIPVKGTLGLVLAAKQRGDIPAARPVLEKLRQSGMYLSDRVVNEALALVGE